MASMLRSRVLPALALALLAAVLVFGGRPDRADAGIQFLMGDADCRGDINSIDAAVTLQFTADLLDGLPCQRNMHLNPDAVITSVDVAVLLQYIAGLVDELHPVPSYEGVISSLGSDDCRALNTGGEEYVLSDPTAGTPGQNVRIWGFLDASTSECNSTPVLRVVAVVVIG